VALSDNRKIAMAPGLFVHVFGQHISSKIIFWCYAVVDVGAGEEAAAMFLDKRAVQGSTFSPPTTTAGAPTNSGARNST
jgi:hypothetical protein